MDISRQRTLARPAQIAGRGLFHGIDVTLTLLPAPEFHGVVFQRVDLSERVLLPARVDYVAAAPRRTVLSRLGAQVETIEHVLGALAGLLIDNCLIQIDAPECPNGDGSAKAFVDAIDAAGICQQTAIAPVADVHGEIDLCDADVGAQWSARPSEELRIGYELHAPYPGCDRQSFAATVTPERFAAEIACARTFVRESEVQALRALGLGRRTTPQDVLVFDAEGRPIENSLRMPDECVRHKILDAIGDFALCGARLCGNFRGSRTGHRHNHELIRRIREAQPTARRRAA